MNKIRIFVRLCDLDVTALYIKEEVKVERRDRERERNVDYLRDRMTVPLILICWDFAGISREDI